MPNSTILQLELVFALRNEAAFNQCLASLSDPTSPNYQHFLNATTLEPYVPTPGQKQSMVAFLERAGFTVSYPPSPIVLKLTGTVNAISRTFRTRLGVYRQGSASFYSADTEPRLPQNFAVLTNAITGLDNFSLIGPAESPCTGPYCPQGVQIGYGLSNLFSAGYNGAGQTVAIVDAPGDSNTQGAIDTFSSQYGLPSVTLDIEYPDGQPSSWNTQWAAEAAMDVEAVHSVAPGAGIVLLYDTNVMNAVDYVATNHLATIVSNSWVYICASGVCSDTELPPAKVSSVHTRLATDAAQGLTILFASGDDGAKPDGQNLGTEFPASDPNVLAVGATNLILTGCGTNTCTGYGSETGAIISGGGYSGYFSEPSWQVNSIGVKSGRAVPDVSMLGYSPNFWVYSTATNSCAGGSGAGWFPCAGTSLSTPLWAGVLAIALQIKGGGSFGNIAPQLYQLAASSFYSNDFHDITSGSNGGYSAVTGWDPVTGWGTPIANNLVLDLSQAVVFHTNPTSFPGATSPGNLTACGGTFSDGQASDGCGNNFSATANLPSPATDWQFDHWGWSGGVSCTSNTANPTSCSVSSSGSLKAIYSAKIAFYTSPSSVGSIGWGSCSGTTYTNGQTLFNSSLPPEFSNSFSVCAIVPSGYTFSGWSTTGGLSLSSSSTNPTILTFAGPGTITATFVVIYSVVRGTDNGIYYGSGVGGSWTGWTGLPGATLGGPAAVQCGGLLYVAVQGTDNGIYFGSLNTATSVFSGWTRLPGATSAGPGLAADSSCNLYMAVRGTDSGIYLNTYTGGVWQGWRGLPGATTNGPGVAVTATTIYLAMRGTDNGIYFGRITRSGMTFQGWVNVGGATYGRLCLAAVSDSEVYLTVGGTDNGIYLNRWNGAGWAGWVAPAGGATQNGPALLVSGGKLYLTVRGMDNGIYCTAGAWGGSWSAWTRLTGATSSSPTLA
jgi:kumamolisin